MEPRVGVEPTTCRLRIGCSTTELPRLCWLISGLSRFYCPFTIHDPRKFVHGRLLALRTDHDIACLDRGHIRVSQNPLDHFRLYPQLVEVRTEPPPESVPAVPAFSDYINYHAPGKVIEVKWAPLFLTCKDVPVTARSRGLPMLLQNIGQ